MLDDGNEGGEVNYGEEGKEGCRVGLDTIRGLRRLERLVNLGSPDNYGHNAGHVASKRLKETHLFSKLGHFEEPLSGNWGLDQVRLRRLFVRSPRYNVVDRVMHRVVVYEEGHANDLQWYLLWNDAQDALRPIDRIN